MKDDKKLVVALMGPHDRFNYGDILFPFIIEYAFDKISPNSFVYEKYALVNSDFTNKGAFISQNYRTLRRNINNNNINVLVVTGGECLGAKWHVLFSYINKIYHLLSKKGLIRRKLISYEIARKYLGGKSEYPYCVNKKDFKGSIKLLFNTVGSSYEFDGIQINALNNADYISLRDEISYKNSLILSNKTYLVPDSAIILSDVFPINELEKNRYIKNPLVTRIIESNEDYIFFQIAKEHAIEKLDKICKQLNLVYSKLKTKIVLCPIGTAFGHEDHIALKRIYQKLNNNFTVLIESPSIFEIMLLIVNSKLYIGTSLHGVITSMSFGIPYIGLKKETEKLVFYLQTWGEKELNQVYDVDDFASQAITIFNSKKIMKSIEDETRYQKQLYYQSVDRMIKILK